MTLKRYIYQLLLVSLLLLSNSLVSTQYVPVYIWETSKSNEIVPALPRISEDTFKEIVQEKLDKKSFVVIFAEPNLSSEDFGAVDNSGAKIFSQLSSITATKTYLPSVENPIQVLKNIYNNEVQRTTIKDFNVENIKSSVLIVDLDDVEDNESRNDILERHDKAIHNIYAALREKETDVIAIYTAYQTSWIIPQGDSLHQTRNILQATTRAGEANRAAFQTPHFLLYVSDTPFFSIEGTKTNLTDHTATSTYENNVVTVSFDRITDPSVGMVFSFTGGYWTLVNVTLTNTVREFQLRVRDIYAPEPFSYQCTSQAFFQRNDSSTSLTLPGMQIQPFRVNTTRFGDPYYCVGFTSAPIWSGIFVTAILVTIMAIGLSMMMDIRTMDRFDDPKGKTIQINVSE